MRCDGLVLQSCVDGSFQNGETCPNACSDQLGCTLCVPGTGTCDGNTGHTCASDGMSMVDTQCDPTQGMTCDAMTGQCSGACSPLALGNSYIGCDYYPTVTGNPVETFFDFAVAIANTTSNPATVTIDGGALTSPKIMTVSPGSVVVQTLPWVEALKLCHIPGGLGGNDCLTGRHQSFAALSVHGGYHLRSTSPVTVYQFNSLQYEKSGDYSYTNDASLLLPTNAWGKSYVAAAYPADQGGVSPSELAITAMSDGTMVTITSRAATTADQGAPAFAAGTPQTVKLDTGDVLEIATKDGDLTGSLIASDQPVQLISGHYCAMVPSAVPACDHLEESIFPIATLGTHYIINAPAVPELPSGKDEIVRVIATADDTHLTYDPAVTGAPATIAHAGDFVEIPGALSYQLTADHKVLVAQYMEGEGLITRTTGDPAMALAVPREQFRSSYLFHAPINYNDNRVDVTAPTGASVTLDGMPLTFTPIGTSGFGLSRVPALGRGAANDGNHRIDGTVPFGITVYGYGDYTSYWYPGGLDLNTIP
jgi:hypothetical protein